MRPIPVDLAVLGGGLAGYHIALAAARNGQAVALIERRSYVGHELTGTGHAWLRNGHSPHEVCHPTGVAKKVMLRDLLDAGVQVLLLSVVAGLAMDGDRVTGVLLANKFGTQLLPARQVIDTTAAGIAAVHLGGAQIVGTKPVMASYTYLCKDVRPVYEAVLPADGSLGLVDDALRLHTSLLPNTYGVELRWMTARPADGFFRSQLEWTAREKARRLHGWLRERHPHFAEAGLADLAAETAVFAAPPEDPGISGLGRFVWRILPDVSTRDLEDCRDQASAFLAELPPAPSGTDAPPRSLYVHGARAAFSEKVQKGLPGLLQAVRVQWPQDALCTHSTQLLVGGLGTSGSVAALSALEEGMDITAVSALHDAGGTRTLGRVSGNYFGHTGGIAGLLNEEVAKLSDSLGNGAGLRDRVARMLLYHDRLGSERCALLTGYTLCDAMLRDGRVEAVIAAGDEGVVCIHPAVTVDMTSDADIAAFAGVPYQHGCPQDGSVMTGGQWGDSSSALSRWTDRPYSRDLDVVAGDRYDDLLRALYTAHGMNSDLDFSPLHTLRESRRIRGLYTLTMEDVLLKRTFADTVAVGRTPYDTHGRASSVLINLGMLEFDRVPLTARIPYRCFLPENVQGLLVGGKAISATRDAASIFRMNADVENAGYALGKLAAQSIRDNVPPHALRLEGVQAALRQAGCLPDWAYDAPIQAQAALEALFSGRDEGLLWTILLPREQVLPDLSAAFASGKDAAADGRIAMALSWFEEEDGLEQTLRLMDDTEDLTDPSQLISPTGYAKRPIVWEGGAGAYHRINRCVTLLGKARYARALPALIALAHKAEAGGPPVAGEDMYHKNRLDKYEVPYFDRIACLCFALSRMADLSAAPSLEALLQKPHLSGYSIRDSSVQESLSMCAWLELQLAEAAARCGGQAGYAVLLAYQDDARPIYRLRAHALLAELTGVPREEGERYSQADVDRSGLQAVPSKGMVIVS